MLTLEQKLHAEEFDHLSPIGRVILEGQLQVLEYDEIAHLGAKCSALSIQFDILSPIDNYV